MEGAVTLAGKGAVNLAAFLMAALKDQKRIKGKVNLRAFRDKKTAVFTLKAEELRLFHSAAKKYSILFATVVDRRDGQCDVIVPIEDAPRVNRIIERFRLSAVKLTQEDQAPETKGGAPTEEEGGRPIRERTAPKDEKADAELLAAFEENPTEAQTGKRSPSAPSSQSKSSSSREASAKGSSEPERPSVRSALAEAVQEAKKLKETRHISPLAEQNGPPRPDMGAPKMKGR